MSALLLISGTTFKTRVLEFNKLQWLKPYAKFSTKKIKQKQTNKQTNKQKSKKDEKALYKLIRNAVYDNTMENMRNRIDVMLLSKIKKEYLKWRSKPSYMS